MKSGEVLRTLHIARQTLCQYVKDGKIKVTKLPNGQYDYDEASVYAFLNKDVVRKTCLYARVSTQKQKVDLNNQIDLLKQFCFMNGYQISGIYSDIASGISFENRRNSFNCWMKSSKVGWNGWLSRIKTGCQGLDSVFSNTCLTIITAGSLS